MLILIDCDGVVVDLFSAYCDHVCVGGMHEKVLQAMSYGPSDKTWVKAVVTADNRRLEDVQRTTDILFNTVPPEWWSSLPAYPYAREVVELCKHYGSVCFVTLPWKPSDAGGKLAWLEREFPEVPRAIISNREVLAAQGVVLVDDNPDNTKLFRRSGGFAATFLQQWTRTADNDVQGPLTADHRLNDLREKLDAISRLTRRRKGR